MDSTQAARLFKCLSEGLRLRLVRLLEREELNGNELRSILGVPQSTLSRHLSVLKDAGLLETRRQGAWSYYRLTTPEGMNGSGDTLLGLVDGLLARDDMAENDRERLEDVLEDRRRAVRDHFQTSGDAWDTLHRRVADHSVKLSAALGLVPRGLTLLDAGCGSGYLLPELVATGAQVIAVDHAPAQLAKAAGAAHELGLEGIDFREGDLASLPVNDASIDGVFAHLALHHAPKPEAAIADMRRVLAPDGVLIVTDFLPHEETWLRDEHADLWLGFEPDAVARWMQAAGLEIEACESRAYALKDGPTPVRGVADLEVFVMRGRAPRSS